MITIDYKDRRPIYEQIVERISQLVAGGVLKPDEQLPSVRQLALELSINPNTIQRAYSELESAGIIYAQKGKGNFVSLSSDDAKKGFKRLIFTKLNDLIVQADSCGIEQAEFVGECARIYQGLGEGKGK